MVVDYERLALRLKSELLKKKSWGQRELLGLLVKLEVECQVPEALDQQNGSRPAHLDLVGTK